MSNRQYFRQIWIDIMPRFPVLMYHRIVSDRCPVPGQDSEEARYGVKLREFESQLRQIADVGGRVVSVRSVHELLTNGESVPPGWIVFTFDDGNFSDYEHARPMLLEHGFSATFFVSVERLGAPGGLEQGMVSQMAAEGLDISSHGNTHRFLTGLSAGEEAGEMKDSKSRLEVSRISHKEAM